MVVAPRASNGTATPSSQDRLAVARDLLRALGTPHRLAIVCWSWPTGRGACTS